jgi:ferric-dicitrate binding protein FerR (iron transport regulator)
MLLLARFSSGQSVPSLAAVPACASPSERADLEQRRHALSAQRDQLRAAIAGHDGACRNVPERSPQAAECGREMNRLISEKNRHIEATAGFNRDAEAARARCASRDQPVAVMRLKGSVFLVDGSGRKPLAPGSSLPPGARIETLDASMVSLQLGSGERIDIGPNSAMDFPAGAPEASLARGVMRLVHDCLAANPGCRRSVDRVRSPVMVAGVRGTEFVVDSNEWGTTVSVLHGLIEVTGTAPGNAAAVQLRDGERVQVDTGGRVGTSSAIPPGSVPDWWN